MSDEEFAERVRRIRWYHEFDFGGGVRTEPERPYRALWAATERLLSNVDFTGKSVLDVGCWDGYWSFYAERRGAARVLATDLNTQRWSSVPRGSGFTPGGPEGSEGFRLAHERFSSRVVYRGDVGAYDLASLGERFDIVLFLGVFYHLTHPMYALTQLRHAVVPGGEVIVESAAIDDAQKSWMEFYWGGGGDEEYRLVDLTNWSVPTRRCLHDMLGANYFLIEHEEFLSPDDTPLVLPSLMRRLRRNLRGDSRYGRALVRARAVERDDWNHQCEPLLGLSQYDVRFQR